MVEKEQKEITLYTDGACTGNPGPGGYGVVLLYGNHRKELAEGYALTTNNRMELMAAIAGLEALKESCKVQLYTDSRYLVDALQKGWPQRWQANNWHKADGEPTLNSDLWARLIAICKKHVVEFNWVKGHAGNPENERCDTLARQKAAQPYLPPDAGYTPKDTALQSTLPFARPTNPVIAQEPAVPVRNKTPYVKITEEGQPCRKCGTAVIKRVPRAKPKLEQLYYYEYYLYCPGCTTMYTVDEAKVTIEKTE
jgi:ribonuclease HI